MNGGALAPLTLITTVMSPRDIFGVAVRIAGLYVTWNGLTSLVGLAMAALMPAIRFTPSGPGTTVSNMLGGAVAGMAVFSLLQLVVGLWLLRGAPQLVGYAYGEPDERASARGAVPHEARA